MIVSGFRPTSSHASSSIANCFAAVAGTAVPLAFRAGSEKKGKRGSGNPAKRAAQEKAAAARESGAGGAGAFGFDQQAEEEFEIPKELRDLM